VHIAPEHSSYIVSQWQIQAGATTPPFLMHRSHEEMAN